jgi:hypothetical protein
VKLDFLPLNTDAEIVIREPLAETTGEPESAEATVTSSAA